MARPIRSPVLGFNHNVKYRGRIFHVQTEDSGPISPRIFTHLYFGGTILASKKHEYDPAAAEDVVRALMQSQHKAILKELKASRHDGRITSFFDARGEKLEAGPASGETRALDLDAAPLPEEPTISTPMPQVAMEVPVSFSDAFDDEPTTLDPPSYSAVSSTADVIEEPDLPAVPAAAAAPRPTTTASYPTPIVPHEAVRRRTPRGTPTLGGAVIIQRTVGVGGEGGLPIRGPLRSRRPAQSIPYVVKEGTHPLAEPQTEARANPELPVPAAPVTASSPATEPAPEPVADRSLDEVILAYLAGGENDPR